MAAASVSDADLTERFERFFRRYYETEVNELAGNYPNSQRGIEVCWEDIYRFDPDIADDLLEHPDKVLEHAEEALRQYDTVVDADLSGAEVRIVDLHSSDVFTVGEYRSDDVNSLIGITGLVNKATDVHPQVEEAAFECQRCGTLTYIPQSDGFQEPHECQGCERQGPFGINYDQSVFHDHRLIRLQKPPDKSTKESGGHIDVHLDRELVEQVQAGDRVTISAILRIEQQKQNNEKTRSFDVYADAEGVEILETDFSDIEITAEDEKEIKRVANNDPYPQLVDSFAPGIWGYEHVKLAMILQLFGGVTKHFADGTVERGISHMLNIGDPGTGKSSLLNYTAKIAPRVVKTNGKGSSAAGITASAVRDDFGPGDEWSIEGGALVQADKGVAVIDELDKMSEEDRSSLHEALEHMEINIAKAGMTPTLKARTIVVAAANPVYGRFDQYAPISEQIDLDPALISRFDMIFTFTDSVDEERDRKIAAHKNQRWERGLQRERGEFDGEVEGVVEPELDAEFIQKYIAYAKENVVPGITDEIKELVEEEYIKLRQANDLDSDDDSDDEPVPVTARKQEAIHRYCEASARGRLSETVERCDVERVMELIRQSLSDIGKDPETGKLDADIVETGQSKSQRDRIKTVEAVIRDFSEDGDDWGAPMGEVISFLVDECDMDADTVENDIEKMKSKGEVYNPEDDIIGMTT